MDHAAVIRRTLFGRNRRQLRIFGGRHKFKIYRMAAAGSLIHLHNQFMVLTERQFGIAEFSVFGSPYQHVTLTGRQKSLSLCIGLLPGYSIELRIIIELELHTSIRHRISMSVHDRNCGLSRRCIVTDYIDFRISRSDRHHFLRSFITSEDLGMHQHTATGRSIEPTKVEYRFGFAGSKKIPFPVRPCFYPCMIVVGMRPPGCVDLTSRDTHRTQGGNQQGRFLATTPVCRAYRCQRRTGTGIGGSIDSLLVAPVVHLQNGIIEGQRLDTILQFFVKHYPCTVQMLIVDPHRKYKMTKQILRNNFSPRHLIGSLLGGAHVHQMKFSGIIGNVCQRHIGIKELQSFAFVRRQVRIEYGKQIALRQPFFFLIEVLLHTLAVRSVCNERTFAARGKQTYQSEKSQKSCNSFHNAIIKVEPQK